MESGTYHANKLRLRSVESMHQAMVMRVIRNSVRQYMTHNRNYITPKQQEDWFKDIYMPKHEAGEIDAYIAHLGGRAMGYGIIQTMDDKKWLTGALIDGYRGQGLGEDLFMQLTHKVYQSGEDTAYLDVLPQNTAAHNLYRKIGYCAVSSDNALIVMKRAINEG